MIVRNIFLIGLSLLAVYVNSCDAMQLPPLKEIAFSVLAKNSKRPVYEILNSAVKDSLAEFIRYNQPYATYLASIFEPLLIKRVSDTEIGINPQGTCLVFAVSNGMSSMSNTQTRSTVNLGTGLTSILWSKDNSRIAAEKNKRTIVIIDSITGLPQCTVSYPAPIRYKSFSPDSSKMLVCTSDHLAQIIDASSGKVLGGFKLNGEPFTLIWGPDSSKVIIYSRDTLGELRYVHLINAYNGDSIASIDEISWLDNHQHFTDDSSKLLIVSGNKATLIDTTSGSVILTIEHDANIKQTQFSRDNKHIATVTENAKVRITPIEKKAIKHDIGFEICCHEADSVVFSPDDSKIFISGYTGKILDLCTGKIIKQLTNNYQFSYQQWSIDSSKILLQSYKTVDLVDLKTPRIIYSMTMGIDDYLRSAQLVREDSRLVIASKKNIKIIDAVSGCVISDVSTDGIEVNQLIFAPDDSKCLVLLSKAGAYVPNMGKIINTDNGKIMGTINIIAERVSPAIDTYCRVRLINWDKQGINIFTHIQKCTSRSIEFHLQIQQLPVLNNDETITLAQLYHIINDPVKKNSLLHYKLFNKIKHLPFLKHSALAPALSMQNPWFRRMLYGGAAALILGTGYYAYKLYKK